MQTITLEIIDDKAIKVLQELQDKHFINIVAKSDLSSPVFPGKPLNQREFEEWARDRENGPAMTLKEAKKRWQRKKDLTTLQSRPPFLRASNRSLLPGSSL